MIWTTILSVHQPFKYKICDYSCSQNMDINRHVASAHKGKKPFKFDILCDFSCTVKSKSLEKACCISS